MTLHDVLRALVRGESANLNSPGWVAEALDAIDGHEQDSAPAPEPVPVAEQKAAGVPAEATVTVADQRAGVPAPVPQSFVSPGGNL